MTLGELFCNILDIPEGCREIEVTGISTDSRVVEKGHVFVSLQGSSKDGNSFIHEAVQQGASVVVVKRGSVHQENDLKGAVRIEHDDPKTILPRMLNCFYRQPSAHIDLIGVTGTNGKTTITYLMESIYRNAGKSCGVIGTINYRFSGKVFPAKNTTPGVADNFSYIGQMIEAGMEACVMEVSSHALTQGRVDGLMFQEAVFTNLTSDHLDYHRNQEKYFLAKSRLFDGSLDVRLAVINIDDPFGERLKAMSKGRVWTYGIDRDADFKAEGIRLSLSGTTFQLKMPGESLDLSTPLLGKHNVYNILAAAAVARNEGFSPEEIKQGIETLRIVPGRLERIEEAADRCVLVDYAHTEDALKNVLESIRQVSPKRILVVFGCGGDRDKTKRPKMAAVVEGLADFSIVTNDNPRTEDPEAIARDVVAGFQNDQHQVILDRRQAIHNVLDLSRPGDCVLIAGKGHEDYQIFKDRTVHFDDREVVREILKG